MAKKNDQEEIIVDVKEVYTKTEMFVDRNRKTLTYVIGGLALLLIGFYAYRLLVVKPKEEKANSEIWKAEQYFEIDSLDLAISGDGLYVGLEDIAANYDGTKAANRANYELGIISRDRGQFDEAIAYFEKADIDDDVISSLVQMNIGDCYVELNKYEEATKFFEKAISKAKGTDAEGFTASMAMFKAGITYMELGQKEKAAKLFETIVEDYPDSQVKGRAERYAAYLGHKL
ncbi:MAG: hypothetical protein RL226_1338 [Bacteroidota bacterium]